MADTSSKTDKFLQAIEKYAEEQRSKIRSESELFKEKEIAKAEEDGIREAYVLIQRKMAEIKTQISASLSKQETASRQELFLRRAEITDEVFDKAKNKLLDFTKSDKYKSFLLKNVEEIANVLKGEITLFVKADDMKYEADIKKALGNKCTVRASEQIAIGGVIGKSFSAGLIADESLDSKLQEQREWFCINSGLRVTE